jgi:hypothetical protein
VTGFIEAVIDFLSGGLQSVADHNDKNVAFGVLCCTKEALDSIVAGVSLCLQLSTQSSLSTEHTDSFVAALTVLAAASDVLMELVSAEADLLKGNAAAEVSVSGNHDGGSSMSLAEAVADMKVSCHADFTDVVALLHQGLRTTKRKHEVTAANIRRKPTGRAVIECHPSVMTVDQSVFWLRGLSEVLHCIADVDITAVDMNIGIPFSCVIGAVNYTAGVISTHFQRTSSALASKSHVIKTRGVDTSTASNDCDRVIENLWAVFLRCGLKSQERRIVNAQTEVSLSLVAFVNDQLEQQESRTRNMTYHLFAEPVDGFAGEVCAAKVETDDVFPAGTCRFSHVFRHFLKNLSVSFASRLDRPDICVNGANKRFINARKLDDEVADFVNQLLDSCRLHLISALGDAVMYLQSLVSEIRPTKSLSALLIDCGSVISGEMTWLLENGVAVHTFKVRRK